MSQSNMTGTVWVRKRDGKSEPFQKTKIADCFRSAILAAGESSPTTARELADAVTTFIHGSRHGQPLRTRQIAALLLRVLEETGHPHSAAAMRAHTQQRDRRRRRLQVLAWKASVGRIVPRRWNKSVLVNRLQKTYGLEPLVSRLVAARVEEVVLALNLRLVTGGLIRELVDCELMAWGLADQSLSVRSPHRSPAG